MKRVGGFKNQNHPALVRQRQVDLCQFEASLVFKASPRQPGLRRHRERETLSQNQKTNKNQNQPAVAIPGVPGIQDRRQ